MQNIVAMCFFFSTYKFTKCRPLPWLRESHIALNQLRTNASRQVGWFNVVLIQINEEFIMQTKINDNDIISPLWFTDSIDNRVVSSQTTCCIRHIGLSYINYNNSHFLVAAVCWIRPASCCAQNSWPQNHALFNFDRLMCVQSVNRIISVATVDTMCVQGHNGNRNSWSAHTIYAG